MKPRRLTIFGRIIVLVFILVSALGLLFSAITYVSATRFYEASTQQRNKDVAGHIAKFTSPFKGGRFNRRIADSIFHDAMVLSPSSEIYFLDNSGAVVGYHSDDSEAIRQAILPLQKIETYLADSGHSYLRGPDPRDPARPKIFSAAEVRSDGKKLGYIYVILDSRGSREAAAMLIRSHVGQLVVTAAIAILLLSLVLSIYYIARLQRRFRRMVAVLERFQAGDLGARFRIHTADDLAPITDSFNKMADALVHNIARLTKSEAERKTFIAGIAHDLRTPVSIARGYAETLLTKTGQAASGNEYAVLVVKKMAQVEALVAQLHELSVVEAVTTEPQREPFMFSEVLLETVHSFRGRAAERGIRMDCTKCEDHAFINADIRLMERVIQNLVINAIQHSPEGSRVEISLQREESELLFIIQNTGEPLPHDLVQWLNTGEESLAHPRPAKPSIGLMIVKRIVHLHGYRLEVRSAGDAVVFVVRMGVVEVGNSISERQADDVWLV